MHSSDPSSYYFLERQLLLDVFKFLLIGLSKFDVSNALDSVLGFLFDSLVSKTLDTKFGYVLDTPGIRRPLDTACIQAGY